MSYNTRRGNTGNFNKGVSASQVGQRRPPAGSSNYGQNLPSQTSGGLQQQNYGYFTQQTGSKQQPPRLPATQQPSAQQQMAKQQQMLVQKKQQLAQQQKQQQQKQQMVQQKQQANQKQQEEELKRKELELQKQKELELQKQKELEAQKQKELELQKQKELELQKQKALELQKQKALELQQQRELEIQKQKEAALLRQKEIELQKQKELELQRQKEVELQNKKEPELKKEAAVTNLSAEGMEVDPNLDTPMEEAPQPPSISGEGEANPESRPPRRRFPQRNRKLSKYEIQRRRNLKLSKLLQPKSAMVILNEVGKNVTYNVERSQTVRGPKGYMFKATVTVDGSAHEGLGMSKSNAKNEAAERALKFLVKHKKLVQTNTEPATPQEGSEEPMDTAEKEQKEQKIVDIPLAWQQFASFAIYKLLDTWGEDLEIVKEEVKVDKKPAKKMPPNAELMNPLMLMNQMLPRINFEELPRTSNGHFFTFNFRAVVDGKTFTGSGVSKKVAKKSVAFAICSEVLGIQYPPEIYTPPIKTDEAQAI